MAEVIVSTPDLTVLGGPASIQLDTNIGAAGSRGVFVMFGPVDPNDLTAPQFFIDDPILFDLYILVDPSSSDYLQVYQYVIQDGDTKWVPTIKLRPNFYGTNRVVTFIDGVAELQIPTSEIGLVPLRSGEVSFINTRFLFGVQATLSNYNVLSEVEPSIPDTHLPAAVSVKVDDIELDLVDSVEKVKITLYGAEFNGTSMQSINNKSVIAHLSILVIDPSDVTIFLEEVGS